MSWIGVETLREPNNDRAFQQATEKREEGRKGSKAPLPGEAGSPGSPSEDELELEELELELDELP